MIVAFTAANRPEYFAEVLESWSRVRGVGDHRLVFHVEPMNDEVLALANGVDWAEKTVILNPEVYGVLRNPWYALQTGFAMDDFVLLAEDDSIVADDVLEYVGWAKDTYAACPSVLTVCAFHNCDGDAPTHATVLQPKVNATIWGTWENRWPEIRDTWDHDYTSESGAESGWDWNLQKRVRGKRSCVFPLISRSQHIGKHGGSHVLPDGFGSTQSACFQPTIPPVPFYTSQGS